MGLLNKMKNIFGMKESSTDALQTEFETIVHKTWEEYKGNAGNFWNANLSDNTIWANEVKHWTDKKKISFILWLTETIHNYSKGKRSWTYGDSDQERNTICVAFLQSLFRNKLVMDESDVENIHIVFSKYKVSDWSFYTRWPIALMLKQLENQYKSQTITPFLRKILETIKSEILAVQKHYDEKERLKMIDKIDSILFTNQDEPLAIKPARFLGDDEFAVYANPTLDKMAESEKLAWYQLLALAQKATGSKPSEKYLLSAKVIIDKMGPDNYRKTLHEWLQFIIDLKENEQQHVVNYGNAQNYNYVTYDFITPANAEALKGLVWTCANLHDKATIKLIAALAERSFKKIPGHGPAAAGIGNACIYVLYATNGFEGIGQLSRLQLRIKQGNTQTLIGKYLQAAAEKQGVTVSEIEDMAVSNFEFVNGRRLFILDDYTAELVITGVGKTEVKWNKSNGTNQKSVPALVKEKHAEQLKEIKALAKQAEQMLVTQRDRIDRMLRSNRKIAWDNFEEYYLNHGLMCYLTNGIIWNLHQIGGQVVQAIHLNNCWVNAANEIVTFSAEAVSLWHPVQGSLGEITAWRDFLVFHELQQPLKQAYREIYLLTDAEIVTKSYSNRMAAHILRQHQFSSLAKLRGWRYALMGAFDNGIENEKASLQLPDYCLRAEYRVSEVNADGAMNDTGIWNYVSTDRLRFFSTTTNEAVDLVDIPPVVFSEVMRDVDMFVGVASVGNDPVWRDSGELPAYRDYWTSYSFGELSEIAKNRKEILSKLLPRLKIKDVAYIRDKFLIIKGKLRTYKIHIGSTNILMEPNDQYLCIVPDRRQTNYTENVFLPFEGDNGLSVILSKAFLLAEDDKIADTTITSQINRK